VSKEYRGGVVRETYYKSISEAEKKLGRKRNKNKQKRKREVTINATLWILMTPVRWRT
jgi:ribosome-associated translation inhibitor RaiA